MTSAIRSAHPDLPSLLARIREARFATGVWCPRCASSSVQRWGTFSSRQRYRCGGCGRTFSDLTGTPAAHLKKLELLPQFARCLAAVLSVRRSATHIGVHPTTAFRWRHRLCGWLRERDDECLAGIVELSSFWLPESRKGQRNLEMPPRKRGHRDWNRHDGRRMYVVVACDRRGHAVAVPEQCAVSRSSTRPTLASLAHALDGRLDGATAMVAPQGRLGVFARFAIRIGRPYHDATGRPRTARGLGPGASPFHVRAAWDHWRRFRRWLLPFRGVATRYLGNYLAWHQRLDAERRQGLEETALRWAL